MIVNKNQFFEIQSAHFSNIPFNQTKEWLQITGSEDNVKFFVNNIEKPQIACWGRIFSRSFFGLHLFIDGVSYNTDDIKTIHKFYESLINLGYSFIEISDIGLYSTNYDIGLRQAGFIRPILSLSPLSIIVHIQEPFNFHRNWKRNVRKAEEFGCEFEVVEIPSAMQLKVFVELFNQLKIRKSLGFSINEKSLFILLKNRCYKLFFVKNLEGKYLSGRIIYINGENSYDVYAANSDEGIKNGATYYIQEHIFDYIKDLGVNLFDYGRISPSSDEMNNIYVAKNYSGGNPILYNGEWFFSKNKQFGLLYEFYKFFIKKRRRY